MAVVIPSFRFQFPRPGLNAPPSGAVQGVAAGQAIGNLLSGFSQSATQRKQLNAFADAMDAEDPNVAALIRAQANNIPLFGGATSQTAGAGGGRRGGSGSSSGFSGIGEDLLKFSLGQIADRRDREGRVFLENLQNQNSLGRIGAQLSASKRSADHRTMLEVRVAKLKDMLDETITDPGERQRVEDALRLEEGRLNVSRQQAANSALQSKIDIFNANRLSAAGRAAGDQFQFKLDQEGNVIEDPNLGEEGPGIGNRLDIPGVTVKEGRAHVRPTASQFWELFNKPTNSSTTKAALRESFGRYLEKTRGFDFRDPDPDMPQEDRELIQDEQDLIIEGEMERMATRDLPNEGTTFDMNEAVRGMEKAGAALRGQR